MLWSGFENTMSGFAEGESETVAELDELAQGLVVRGITLPQDFMTCYTHSHLRRSLAEVAVDSGYAAFSDPLPSPIEPDAYLVRFLCTDDEDVFWYLYLRPSGEAFVVHSEIEYQAECDARDVGEETRTDLDDMEQQRAAIHWCAPSFEEFLYRLLRLWRVIDSGDLSEFDSDQRRYLDHYTPTGQV